MQKILPLLLVLLATTMGFAQSINTYRLDKMMGTPVYGPRDVAVDRRGNMYILQGGGITKLDSTGRCYAGFSATAAGNQGSLANLFQAMEIDEAGNLYLCYYNMPSGSAGIVRKYGPDGNLLMQFGTAGTGPGQLQQVNGMCVDAAGRIYIVDYAFPRPRLQCFDSQGTLLFAYSNPTGNYDDDLMDVEVDPATGNILLLEEDYMLTTHDYH